MFKVRLPLWLRLLFELLSLAGVVIIPKLYLESGISSIYEKDNLLYVIPFLAFMWFFNYLNRNYVIVDIDFITYVPVIGIKKVYHWNELRAKLIPVKGGQGLKLYNQKGRRICYLSPICPHLDELIDLIRIHGRPIIHEWI